MRGLVKQQHPNYKLVDIAKELGKLWSVADAVTKAHYVAKAEADKTRYERVRINLCTRFERCRSYCILTNLGDECLQETKDR